VGHRQKVFDHGEGMIRQGDRAQANYRRSETLPKHIRGWLLSGQNNVRVGKGTVIRNVDINQGTTINDYCRLFGSPKISIGKNVYITVLR